jgi:hypothetical protein
MFSYLGENRWAAPWGRGQLGGWGSFIDQMPYFGYVLPSLTALLIVKRGLFKFESVMAWPKTSIMLLFLSQGGGRRIIGVTVGAAIIVWVQAQPGMQVKKLVASLVAVIALLVGDAVHAEHPHPGLPELRRERQRIRLPARGRQLPAARADHAADPSEHPFVYSKQIVFALIGRCRASSGRASPSIRASTCRRCWG